MSRTIADAEALAAKLRALPARENKNRIINKADEIKILANEITSLQSRNYSLEEISELLTQDGLEISTGTLKNYLQRCKSTKRPQKKKTNIAPQITPMVGQSIGQIAAASLPAEGDSHQIAQAAITRADRPII